MNFGGGKDEFDMFGRLFHRFQQNVPRHFRKHVDFVDDVNFVLAANGTGEHIFRQFAHGFSVVAAGGVDFNNIK